MEKKAVALKILYFPVTRIITGIIVCVGIAGGFTWPVYKALTFTGIEKDFQNLIVAIVLAVLSVIFYILLYRVYEKRKITEFSKKGFAKNLVYGIAVGAILQIFIILVIFLNGGFSVISFNPVLYIIPSFAMAFQSGILEETVFRGIIFRITEEKLGSYITLTVSALIFGLMHLFNSNISASGILLTILAGLLLAAAYMYTRNLWFPIGIHFAWNFMLAGIFGANVSGFEMPKTLITTRIEGPELLTGGQFGPEASIQANVFCLIATVVLLYLCHKKGIVIKPYWKKPVQPQAFSPGNPESLIPTVK